MKNRTITIAGMVIAVQLNAAAAWAEDPQPPFAAADASAPYVTRGFWLENNLSQILSGCGVPLPLKVKSWGFQQTPISAVPKELRDKIRPKESVYLLSDNDLTRLFGSIWSTQDLLTARQPDSYLPLNYDDDQDQVTMPGITATLYSNSCASVIGATLAANGGGDVGPAALKAALESSYRRDVTNQVDLVTGSFSSPVVSAWKGEIQGVSIPAQRFIAALLFWQWYENNPTANPAASNLLAFFEGDALYHRHSSDTQAAASLRVGAKLKALGAGMDAETEARLTTERRISGRVYQVAIEKKPTKAELVTTFLPMPSLSDVISRAGEIGLQVGEYDRTPIVVAGDERSLVAEIENFPRAYCDKGLWQGTPPLSSAQALDSATTASSDRLTTCRLTFKYVTTTEDINAGAKITPTIARSLVRGGATHKLALTGSLVKIPGASLNVSRTSVVQRAVPEQNSASQVKLTWTTTWRLNGTAARASNPVTVTSALLSCPNLNVNAIEWEASNFTGTNPRSFKITWSVMADGKHADFAAAATQAPCTISGELAIHTASADVPQPFENVSVLYPVLAQQ